jgi:hypothetical protein
MGAFTGFADLKSPEDLLKKLEYDYERMQKNPLDTYAAFDFFIAAEHMPDWWHPDTEIDAKLKKKAIRKRDPILEVCSHIANGSKHFEAMDSRHKSVMDVKKHEGAFSSAFSSAFDISCLKITLDGAAKTTFGESIDALTLAQKVLSFWKSYSG